jgi:hypothetical protein
VTHSSLPQSAAFGNAIRDELSSARKLPRCDATPLLACGGHLAGQSAVSTARINFSPLEPGTLRAKQPHARLPKADEPRREQRRIDLRP